MASNHASRYDALIIGAGIAGCALARALALQGRTILIVDRSLAKPDRIVGELLQPGGVEGLEQLGLSECLEGIEATPVKGYHIYWKDEETSFWFCPTVVTNAKGGTETKAHAGRSFHHGRLVSKMRDAIKRDLTVALLEAAAHEILRDTATERVIGAKCSVNGTNTYNEVSGRTCQFGRFVSYILLFPCAHSSLLTFSSNWSIWATSSCLPMGPTPTSAHSSLATGLSHSLNPGA